VGPGCAGDEEVERRAGELVVLLGVPAQGGQVGLAGAGVAHGDPVQGGIFDWLHLLRGRQDRGLACAHDLRHVSALISESGRSAQAEIPTRAYDPDCE